MVERNIVNGSPQRRRDRKEKLKIILCDLCDFAVKKTIMTENEISSKIIGAAIEVHKELGAGLLESSYEVCLAYELRQLGLSVQSQVALPVVYKDIRLDAGYRIDILVENKVIIEVKSVDSLADIHTAQLLTYLKLKNLKLGLLINFNNIRVVDGIKRVVNNL